MLALGALLAASEALAEDPPPAVAPEVVAPSDDGRAATAALRSAREALARGEVDRGVALLAAVEERHEIVSDHAALLAARALLDAGRPAEAAAVIGRFDARGIATPLASDLERARGDAALARGDAAAARRAYSHALAGTEDSARLAPLLRELATLEEADGDLALAAERWLRLWRDVPAQPAARGSAEKLVALGSSLGRELRSAEDARKRGDRLFDAGLRAASVDAYELALARGLEGEDRRAVERRRGDALFGLRRYAEAQSAFASLGDDPDAQVMVARCVARSGDVEGAIALLLAQSEKRPGPDGAGARWYAALLLEGEDETARAEPLFARVAAEATDPALATNARWRLGFAAFRAGRAEEAAAQFARMAEASREAIPRLQARYWGARAAEKAGRADEANEALGAIVRDAPFSYYGFRARERLAKRGALPKPEANAAPLEGGTRAIGPRDALRARILVDAGLGPTARDEIERLTSRIAGPDDALQVAELFQAAGIWDRSQAVVLKRVGEALPAGPAPGREGLWRAAWPRAFRDAVLRSTASTPRLEPPLVFALMREESSFRPSVSSSAGAVGLMQLMPATAERVARQVGMADFDEAQLTDPAVNVRLGTTYLDGLLGRFGGRASAAIGSYNAGPEPVARWLAERPGLADDEWIEAIPYEETRNYVKRVLRSLHVYRELYADG